MSANLPDEKLNPSEMLSVKAIQDRVFRENLLVLDRRDPIFAFVSVCRSLLEAYDQLLEQHNQAIDRAMIERVEVMTRQMTHSLDQLKEEALTENLKYLLESIQAESLAIKTSSDKFYQHQMKAETDAKRFKKFIMVNTSITALSAVLAVTVATLILR